MGSIDNLRRNGVYARARSFLLCLVTPMNLVMICSVDDRVVWCDAYY
jgi:hypothetical protein